MSAAATTMVAYTHIKPDSKRRRSCLYRPPQIHMPSNNSSMLATTPKTTMNMASSLWLWLLPAHDKYQINILLMGGSFSVFFLFSSHASFVRRHYAKGSSKLFFTISFKFCIFIFFSLRCRCCRLRANWSRQQQLVRCTDWYRTKYSVKSYGTHYIKKKWHATTDGVFSLFRCAAACLQLNVSGRSRDCCRKRERDSIVLNCVSRTQYAVALLCISSGDMIVAWPIYRRSEWY